MIGNYQVKKYIGLLWLLLIIPNYHLILYMYNTFDYCVTHVCGCTHNYGIQTLIWTIYPISSMLLIIMYSINSVYKNIRK